MSVHVEPRPPVLDPSSPPRDGEMVELALLLPERQFVELEMAARGQGLTTGQMLRRLINAFLHEPA